MNRRCQDAEEEKQGHGGIKGLVEGTRDWCRAYNPIYLYVKGEERKNCNGEALEYEEWSQAALLPNLCPHLGNQ